jgi:PAS domain S-box-containing protein
MKNEYKILVFSALLGLLSWMIPGILDSFFFKNKSFLNMLFKEVTVYEITMRFSVFVSFLIFGIVVSIILAHRRKMEEGQRQTERNFRALIEKLPQKIFFKDRKSAYISCNRNYARELKIKSTDITGKTDYDFFPKEIADIYRANDKRILEFGRIEETEKKIIKDGDEVWVHKVKVPVKDERSNIIGILGIFWDITERKRTAEVLRERERRLKEAESIAQMGNWDWNIETNELLWSDEIFRIFGLNSKEFGGTLEAFLEFVHPEDRDRVKGSINDALNKKMSYSIDHRIVLPDRSVRIVHEKATVFFSDVGKPIRMSGTVQDITERKKMENELEKHRDHLDELVKEHTTGIEKLNNQLKRELTEREHAEEKLKESLEEIERSNRDLEQFAYAASHDLQEPLRMVASYTQLLEKRYKDHLDDDAKDFIKYASEGATRMQKLIEGLLSYSRIQTRGNPFQPTECNSVVKQAISNLQVRIGEIHAIVESDDLPTVKADEIQLVRLFQNLVSNALKFQRNEIPRIQISASRQGNKWMFSVSDNGIGIDSNNKERIFVIFQRLHGEEEYPGTGMGLAICKRIVERHSGQIWVDSDPGQGSIFYFTIPCEKV